MLFCDSDRMPHPLTLPRHPRPDRGSPQSKTPCCHQTAWGLPLIIQQAVRPLTLDIIDLLYIRRTRRFWLFQCDALPSISCPCIVGKVGSKAFNISLILIENEVTTANLVSEVIKHLSTVVVNGSNHRTEC